MILAVEILTQSDAVGIAGHILLYDHARGTVRDGRAGEDAHRFAG